MCHLRVSVFSGGFGLAHLSRVRATVRAPVTTMLRVSTGGFAVARARVWSARRHACAGCEAPRVADDPCTLREACAVGGAHPVVTDAVPEWVADPVQRDRVLRVIEEMREWYARDDRLAEPVLP
jgi:hypothetical protein